MYYTSSKMVHIQVFIMKSLNQYQHLEYITCTLGCGLFVLKMLAKNVSCLCELLNVILILLCLYNALELKQTHECEH